MGKSVDITNQRFGRLTVIACNGRDHRGHMHYLCRCDCNAEKIIARNSLLHGRSKSCGCLRKEVTAKHMREIGRRTIHGAARNNEMTGEYRSWRAMKCRTTNPNDPYYKIYGGRGITVCERWINSFAVFLQDMGPKPSPEHTLDRINNDGNYEPGNVRWATRKEQNANKRNPWITRRARNAAGTFMGQEPRILS